MQHVTQAQVLEVESVGMTVFDMDKALTFYSEVLSFEKVSDREVCGTEYEHLQGLFGLRMRVIKMKLGDEEIELTEYLTPKGKPIPVDSRSNDLWFQHIAIVVSDMEKAYQHLRENNVQHVSTAPQRIPDWNKAAAGVEAFYFRDPDQHNLEIIYFPPGKGNPKWQTNNSNLFLGIDHTAIAVSRTKKSLQFYRDLLGFTVAGESENYGTEQEHLNNVFGARLHITGLKAQQGGPGIEFLEYLSPSDGRAYPPDAKPNDLVYWQTTVIVENIEKVAEKIRRGNYKCISSYVINMPDENLGFKKGIVIRDLDGHAMRVMEK